MSVRRPKDRLEADFGFVVGHLQRVESAGDVEAGADAALSRTNGLVLDDLLDRVHAEGGALAVVAFEPAAGADGITSK